MTRTRSAIAATGLRKSFGDHLVLDGVNLDVAEGTIFALLGPNGAGKTTIVQILSTLIGADAGALRVAGHDLTYDPDAVRAAIGITGQFSAVDNLLTGQENLILMADLHHLGRAEGRRPRRLGARHLTVRRPVPPSPPLPDDSESSGRLPQLPRLPPTGGGPPKTERPESFPADRPIDHHVAGRKAAHPDRPGRPRNDRNHTTPQPRAAIS
jgi:hypothetical protein